MSGSNLKLCASCPVRLTAALTRSNGLNTAALIRAMGGPESQAEELIARCEGEAKEIESSGCEWWWSRAETNTQDGSVRHIESCGRSYLPHFMMAQGNLTMECAETLQSTRNAMHEDLDGLKVALSHGLAAGFGAVVAALPGDVASRLGTTLEPPNGSSVGQLAGQALGLSSGPSTGATGSTT